MPVVGRGHDNRIKILAGAELSKIVVSVTRLGVVFFGDRLGSGLSAKLSVSPAAMRFVRIARSDNLYIGLTEKGSHHSGSATTGAGEANGDAVAWRDLCSTQHGTGHNGGNSHGCQRGGLQKTTSV